jgi:hypothetical protein
LELPYFWINRGIIAIIVLFIITKHNGELNLSLKEEFFPTLVSFFSSFSLLDV